MSWPDFFYPHSVDVRDIGAGSGLGESFGSPRTLAAEIRDEQRLVTDRDGKEVVSSTQVTVAFGTHIRQGSLVTVWKGLPGERSAKVVGVGINDNVDDPLDSFVVLSLE